MEMKGVDTLYEYLACCVIYHVRVSHLRWRNCLRVVMLGRAGVKSRPALEKEVSEVKFERARH